MVVMRAMLMMQHILGLCD